jgi:hypothetical protein
MQKIWKKIVIGVWCSALGACNSSSFNGEAGRRQAPPPNDAKNRPLADKFYKLACENGTGDANLVTQLAGASSTTVSLEGEFCGLPSKVASGQVTVFFIVDLSGSMALSDPTANGTCGRFTAAQALVQKLSESSKSGIDVKVGLATFGNGASIAVPVTSLGEFETRLSAREICRQDAGGTNYEAAFVTAQTALRDAQGQKIVYFISDGLPSVSNQVGRGGLGGLFGGGNGNNIDISQVYTAGVQAAEALRSNNVILDVVYLDSASARAQSQQVNGGQPVEDPAAYLEKIAGSKDRVRLVTSAGELAGQITTFDNPSEVSLNADSVYGEVNAGTLGSQKVKIRSLTKDPNRPGIWLFVTEAFKLYAKTGTSVENKVTLTVNGADGKAYKASATINFSSDD